MEKYSSVYYDEIKKRLEKQLDLDDFEIYTFTNDENKKEFYIQYYSDMFQTKILTKIDKQIIYQIRGFLEQQKQNNDFLNGRSR